MALKVYFIKLFTYFDESDRNKNLKRKFNTAIWTYRLDKEQEIYCISYLKRCNYTSPSGDWGTLPILMARASIARMSSQRSA